MKRIIVSTLLCALGVSVLGAGTIRILAPVGGESPSLGSAFLIRWTAEDVTESLNVVLMKDDAILGRIASGLPATQTSFNWTVGSLDRDSAPTGGGYRIRVAEAGGARSAGQSPEAFSIVPVSGMRIRDVELQRALTPSGEPCDFSVSSMTIEDGSGNALFTNNGQFMFPYDGLATPGVAVIRLYWNGRPAGTAGTACRVPLEVGMRHPSGLRVSLGSHDAGSFDLEGNAEVRAPFTIQAGKAAGDVFEFDARIQPQPAACDANAANNRMSCGLRLQPFQERHDLQVQIEPDIELKQSGKYWGPFLRQTIDIRARFKVRDFPGGPAAPVANIRCLWYVLGEWDSDRLTKVSDGPDNYVTIPIVGAADWATKTIEGQFTVRLNYWEDLQLVVLIDCDERVNDIDRRNNRRDRSFHIREITKVSR
jgi:hypothetical protein